MTKIKESIVDKIVNGITFLKFLEKTKAGDYWLTKCHCGNEKILLRNNVITGHTKSCGCTSRKTVDLTNKRFGKIICIQIIGSKNQCKLWECKCDCGVIFTEQSNYIMANRVTSCGCDHKNKISQANTKNITNQKFGRLTTIEIIGHNKSFQKIWLCKCDCGNFTKVDGSCLRTGRTKSCGCLIVEAGKKRRGSLHPNYNPNLTNEERTSRRAFLENREWSKQILIRDKFTCQVCRSTGKLHAHHILPYFKYKDLRLDLTNGICLCIKCHRKFHKIYGINVNKDQLQEFFEMNKITNNA